LDLKAYNAAKALAKPLRPVQTEHQKAAADSTKDHAERVANKATMPPDAADAHCLT
jgi:hypothetical protein